jgi:hypothetical protein
MFGDGVWRFEIALELEGARPLQRLDGGRPFMSCGWLVGAVGLSRRGAVVHLGQHAPAPLGENAARLRPSNLALAEAALDPGDVEFAA